MQLADFFIGKPGSGSLSEAVHMGLPPIVTRNAWTMPQERYCTEWVGEQGLGLVLPSFRSIASGVQALLADLPRYQAATRRMHNRAAAEVPQALLDQLAIGGRLVIPVGAGDEQELLLIVREEDGFSRHVLDAVRFVPLLQGPLL